jgi:hypothetical protein
MELVTIKKCQMCAIGPTLADTLPSVPFDWSRSVVIGTGVKQARTDLSILLLPHLTLVTGQSILQASFFNTGNSVSLFQ